jgi:hypothetical protein
VKWISSGLRDPVRLPVLRMDEGAFNGPSNWIVAQGVPHWGKCLPSQLRLADEKHAEVIARH